MKITLGDEFTEFQNYYRNISSMLGEKKILATVSSVNGDVRFYGLFETSMNLEGIDRHQRLVTSYQKLHEWRAANAER